MKIGNRKEKASRTVNPSKNQSKRNFLLIVVIVITVLLIMWVYRLGKKAEAAHGKSYPHLATYNPKATYKKMWIYRMK